GHGVNTPLFERIQQNDVAYGTRHLRVIIFPCAYLHFAVADGKKLVMHPELYRLFPTHPLTLSNLVLVMWKAQIHTASVDVELFSQVPGRHRGALNMPAGEAYTPGTRPVHLATFIAMLPQCKVLRRVFILGHFHLLAPMSARSELLNGVARKLSIARETANIVVNITICYIGKPLLDKFFGHSQHFWNMLGRLRIDMRRQNVHLSLVSEVLLSVIFGYRIGRASRCTGLVL